MWPTSFWESFLRYTQLCSVLCYSTVVEVNLKNFCLYSKVCWLSHGYQLWPKLVKWWTPTWVTRASFLSTPVWESLMASGVEASRNWSTASATVHMWALQKGTPSLRCRLLIVLYVSVCSPVFLVSVWSATSCVRFGWRLIWCWHLHQFTINSTTLSFVPTGLRDDIVYNSIVFCNVFFLHLAFCNISFSRV